MANISENLLALNEAKQAIKTAIENKGQDLTGVSLAGYVEKIAAIAGGKKFTTGTVTFAKAQARQTITHNLGVVPTMFILFPTISQNDMVQSKTYGYRYFDVNQYGTFAEINLGTNIIKQTLEYSSTNGALGWQNATAGVGQTIDEKKFETSHRSAAYLIPTGIEFGWIAIE